MTNCNSLPKEYESLGPEIEEIVGYEIDKNEKHLDCIKRNIKVAESIEGLTLVSDQLNVYLFRIIEDVVSNLKEKIKSDKTRFLGHYNKLFPYNSPSKLLFTFIKNKVEEQVINRLAGVSKAFIDKVKEIAKRLDSNGYSIMIGVPLTFTITLHFGT